MKRKPTLIILQGHPCTGKSSLLNQVCRKLNLPNVSRDELKEMLFDRLGTLDREWSMKLGGASYDLFFATIEKLLLTKASFVIESNFEPHRHREVLAKMIDVHDYDVLEVLLDADPKIILKRFKDRWESGERHCGHVDHERYADLESRVRNGNLESLSIGQRLIKIDTSDYNTVDWSELFFELELITGKHC